MNFFIANSLKNEYKFQSILSFQFQQLVYLIIIYECQILFDNNKFIYSNYSYKSNLITYIAIEILLFLSSEGFSITVANIIKSKSIVVYMIF